MQIVVVGTAGMLGQDVAEVLGEDPRKLEVDLYRIWKPFGVWKRFIDKTQAAHKD